MTKRLPRARFNSSRLIHLLTELVESNTADPKQTKPSFAEKLGQWLSFTDAIALAAALNNPATKPASMPAQAADSGETIGELFARMRDARIAAIRADGTGKARIRLPAPPADLSAADFTPYRRYCNAHQREMEAEAGQLRAELRAALTRHSPALAQLAALDAVFDKGLGERERSLLARLPVLLETRFEQLKAAAALDSSAMPGRWLATFCSDMQAVLLAELELRLQPSLGLLETLGKACRDEAAAATIF